MIIQFNTFACQIKMSKEQWKRTEQNLKLKGYFVEIRKEKNKFIFFSFLFRFIWRRRRNDCTTSQSRSSATSQFYFRPLGPETTNVSEVGHSPHPVWITRWPAGRMLTSGSSILTRSSGSNLGSNNSVSAERERRAFRSRFHIWLKEETRQIQKQVKLKLLQILKQVKP